MATLLFWNLGKRSLSESLFRLVTRHEIDVLILAECDESPGPVTLALNREGDTFTISESLRDKIQIFTRFGREFLESRLDAPRWTIRQLLLPGLPDILIVAVHLPSKVNWSDASQSAECYELARDIRDAEQDVGHRRTLVVGDFNMNPFEAGMLAANGLHGETTRLAAEKISRVVDEREHAFFYNPMWNFFGDATNGPQGTFHYTGAEMVRMSWNMFDQVLLRSDLLPYFRFDELEILTGDGEKSFLTKRDGVPGANRGSDHLPILFKLNL